MEQNGFILEGAVKNTGRVSIPHLEIYTPKLEGFKVGNYSKDMLLDSSEERNKIYGKFEVRKNEVTIDAYPPAVVKDFTAGAELVGPHDEFRKIDVAFPGRIQQKESVFFRIWCFFKLPVYEHKYLFIKKYQLDLKIYPNAYPEIHGFPEI